MQDLTTRTPDDELPESRPRSFRLLALVLAVALVLPIAYAAYRNITDSTDSPPTDPNSGFTEPDFSLTDEEAIARFQELDDLRSRAYENADITLVSEFAGPGPFKDQVLEEIGQLHRDDTTATAQTTNQNLEVISNDTDTVSLLQVATINIRFFNSAGKNITTQGKPQRFTIEWTMRSSDEGWLLTESVATKVKTVR